MAYITRCNPSGICLDQPNDIYIASIEPTVDHATHSIFTWILNLTEPTADDQTDEQARRQAPWRELNVRTMLVPNTIWEHITNGVEIWVECSRIKPYLNYSKEQAIKGRDYKNFSTITNHALLCCRIPPFTHYSDPLGTSQYILYANVRCYLDRLRHFGRDPPLPDSPIRSYVIRNSQLGGRGIFANRDLNVGDLIMVERPMIVMPTDPLRLSGTQVHPDVDQRPSSSTRKSLFNDALQIAFSRMSKKNTRAFMALHNAFPNNRQSELNGILETNSFGCGQRGDFGPTRYAYFATYKTMARLNHSCTPNSTAKFDRNSFSQQLRVTRPIRANDEILITYKSIMFQPIAKERQKSFEEMGFRYTADQKSPTIYAQYIHTTSTLLLLWMSVKGLDGLEQYAAMLLMHIEATEELSKLVATAREKENLEEAVKMWKKLSYKYKLAHDYA